MSTPSVLRMYGRDHEVYGDYGLAAVSANTAATMSAGSDEEYASSAGKTHVNEDALLVVEHERHTLLCVADAHFGRESAEELIDALASTVVPVPANPNELDDILRDLARTKSRTKHGSETTLAIVVWDRMFRQGFGRSWGDSSIVRVRPGGVPEQLNARSAAFVTRARPKTLDLRSSSAFSFTADRGELLMAFTDGVDECCYRDPDHSITPFVLARVLRETGLDDAKLAAETLTRLALRGVDGNPGGQDNIALAVTRT